MPQLKYWNGSAWVDAVIGAQGTTGIQGLQGLQGTQGIIGDDGFIAQPEPPVNTNLLWLDTDAPSTILGAALLASANTFTNNQLISVNTSGNALEIRQIGAGNALVVEDETNPDATPFVIDATGAIGIGVAPGTAKINIYDASNANTFISGDGTVSTTAYRSSTDATGPVINLRKARGTTASRTTVTGSDVLGVIDFGGYDGTSGISASRIRSEVDGTVSTNIIPSRITFLTSSTSGTVTERMRIDSSGNVGIGTSSPKTKLHTTGTLSASMPVLGTASGSLYVTNTDTNYGLLAGVSSSTGAVWLQAQRTDATATAYDILLNPSGGNVGIGVTSPGKRVDIDGQLRIRNGGTTGYGLLEYGISATATNNWHVGSEGDGTFRWYNGNFGSGTERMRIDSSGNVGIGKTASTKLDVNGTINGTNVTISGASVTTTGKAIAMAIVFGG